MFLPIVWLGRNEGSAASARFDDHVVVVFEDDFVVFVNVEHGDGGELGGDAAGARHRSRIDRVDQRLDDGVVGRVEVVGQGVRTVAVAVKGLVSGRRYDPVVPADVAEVDVERVASAVVAPSLAFVFLLGGAFAAAAGFAVVRVGDQQRLLTSPQVLTGPDLLLQRAVGRVERVAASAGRTP